MLGLYGTFKASLTRETCRDRLVPHCSGTAHLACTNHSPSPPANWLRLSLVREALREIRNLVWRIREIQRRKLDRVGFEVPQLQGQILPDVRENALACCIRDTRNLYTARP
jgi:hypothetical protein